MSYLLPANVGTCDTEACRRGEVRAMAGRVGVFLGSAQKASASARVGWTSATMPRTRLIPHRDDDDSSREQGLCLL